jgi:hydrogenase/urease accessory protein HupE
MLMIVIAVLALGTLYAVSIAPRDQRVIVAIVVIGLTAAGYGVGIAITKAGTDQRTYYSIATAIAGTMVAFMWISNKRKSWPKKEDRK